MPSHGTKNASGSRTIGQMKMLGKRDAFELLSATGVRTDGDLLGKHRVHVRPVTCKDGTTRQIAWFLTELPLPGWFQCWIGIDVTELDAERIKPAAKRT
jgi:hypothetical protein